MFIKQSHKPLMTTNNQIKTNKLAQDHQYNLIYVLTINLSPHQNHECGLRIFKVHLREYKKIVFFCVTLAM